MGHFVDGVWAEDQLRSEGRWRAASSAADAASATGSRPTARRDRTGDGGFKAEPGRYHLYVSTACPWAHRTLIFRNLKKLEDADLALDRRPGHGRARLVVRRRAGHDPGHRQRQVAALGEIYLLADPRYHRPRHRAGAVGQAAQDDRQQRVVRDHPHVQLGASTRSPTRARTLSGRAARARSIRSIDRLCRT